VAHFGDKLTYWLPQTGNKSELVFSSAIDVGEAVEAAFEAATSEKRILHKAAVILHRQIQAAWLTSPHLLWPPKACDLLNSAPTPPSELCDFLHQTITGRQGSNASDRVRRVGVSLAADVCVAATNGKWIMPKHLLLSMALRHLTGSAQLLTIINRFGHCQSYTKVLEIETAIGTLNSNEGQFVTIKHFTEWQHSCTAVLG